MKLPILRHLFARKQTKQPLPLAAHEAAWKTPSTPDTLRREAMELTWYERLDVLHAVAPLLAAAPLLELPAWKQAVIEKVEKWLEGVEMGEEEDKAYKTYNTYKSNKACKAHKTYKTYNARINTTLRVMALDTPSMILLIIFVVVTGIPILKQLYRALTAPEGARHPYTMIPPLSEDEEDFED
ncbi:hypothetical protein BU16DRAFT_557477 [Lophium mytilinum]|uniref:Uncharacterized protein n=1 Tax=Lophium mytilinum TaxID=390894 RepID=A0A6A6R3L2_9PEZI|nr:hypothetical protein BU16DRAFT_557477 [Lophium mytilinum]